jgi:hypothetical protein
VRKDGQEVTRVPMHAVRQMVVCGRSSGGAPAPSGRSIGSRDWTGGSWT